MSLNWPKPNHNHASEYQVAGWPFVTSSAANEVAGTPIPVRFPFVTSWIEIFNTDGTAADTLRVGFTQNGVTANPDANFLVLSGGQGTGKLELRCNEIWFLKHGSNPASFSVVAGLTNVDGSEFPVITGSNGFVGVG